MLKVFKLLTIVTIAGLSTQVGAFHQFLGAGGDTMGQVRSQLWQHGVNTEGRQALFGLAEATEERIQEQQKERDRDWRSRYPEELTYPLIRMGYF